MHVRYRLPGVDAVLEGDVEAPVCQGARSFGVSFCICLAGAGSFGGGGRSGCEMHAREHMLDFLHRGEDVGYLGGGEICEALDAAVRDDEGVAWEERFYIDDCVAQRGTVKDLGGG